MIACLTLALTGAQWALVGVGIWLFVLGLAVLLCAVAGRADEMAGRECIECGERDENCRCGEYDDDDAECSVCDGKGEFFGEDLPGFDFGWHLPDKQYACPSCHGTGNRRDMTIW